MTAVVCQGMVTPFELFGGYPPPRSLDPPDGPLSITQQLEIIESEIDRAGAVINVLTARDSEQAQDDLLRVRSLLGTNRYVPLVLDLPPLAASVIACELAAIASLLPHVGLLAAGVELLERELVALAWLRSVGKLDWPSPTMGQHLRSMMPGRGFAVTVRPEPAVTTVSRAELPTVSGEGWLAVVAPGDHDVPWVNETVLPSIGVQRAVGLPLPPDADHWWGTNRVVEVVVCPEDLNAAAHRIYQTYPCTPCVWCGEPIHGLTCPVCAMVQAPELEAAGGVVR